MTIINDTAESSERAAVGDHDTLQNIIDVTPVSVFVVGTGWYISACNRSAFEAFSKDGRTLVGKRLSEVVRDLRLHECFRSALEDAAPSDLQLEFIGRHKKKYDVHIAPIGVAGEKLAIGFFRDTTQLERLETARQEFLSNISHELRTPLTSIIAFVETLQDGAVDDPENNRRFLEVIRRNADRMKMLIDDILELSQIESGSVSIELSDIHLRSAIEAVFASLSSKAAARGVTLIDDVPTEILLHADPVRLDQMLTNLIDNAIKFNQQGGSVRVSHEMSAERHAISVADTGEGIMPEHLERIFERFYRTDRARSREIGGTGLGLAIVKHLARLHGGEVSATSELTKGSIFRIEIPVR